MKSRSFFLFVAILACACTKSQEPSAYIAKGDAANEPSTDDFSQLVNNTELMRAVVQGDIAKVRELIQLGVDVNSSSVSSADAPVTPLLAAVLMHEEKIAWELILAGASPAVSHRGYSLLEFARDKGFSSKFLDALRAGK